MATWDRYTNDKQTGFEVKVQLGGIFTPRSYCDDPTIGPVGIYIAKAPVCKLKLTPHRQIVNLSISWDISLSTSATSTIATYDISFGGGGSSDVTGAAWSGSKTGTVTYTSIGSFVVRATVTDLLGVSSKPVIMTAEITEADPSVSGDIYIPYQFIGTTDTGLFTSEYGKIPVASNTGLTGNQLKVRTVRINPHFVGNPYNRQHIWLTTYDGVSWSSDSGTTWLNIDKTTLGTPENAAGDSPAPATADLDQIDLMFDPEARFTVYLLRTTVTRAWLYKTTDYGSTWTNKQVGYDNL